MAEKKRNRKRKSSGKKAKERVERRFLPERTRSSNLAVGLGMASSLALGVGVYGQWLQPPPPPYAVYFVICGAIGLAIALFLNSRPPAVVRVGDAGVALEKGEELRRFPWYAIENASISGRRLVLKTSAGALVLEIDAQPKATSRIVQELAQRLSDRVDISPSQHDALVKVEPGAGELMPIRDIQVAGEKCAASGTLISFEADARICPNCAQIYHKAHVPQQCTSCRVQLTGSAIAVA